MYTYADNTPDDYADEIYTVVESHQGLVIECDWDDLRVDANQGETKGGYAFGFLLLPGQEEYCSLFFTWPGTDPGIETEEEFEAVLDSLEYDAENCREPHVPMPVAREALAAYLRRKYVLCGEAE